MTDSTLISAETLKHQRQTLRHQRRLKAWQGVWRFVALCGMTGGLVWGLSLPHWMIRSKSQINITGHQFLKESQIQAMLPIDYPQSIWQLPINRLKQTMVNQPPIDEVYFSRQLFPTQLTMTVKERQPVAEAEVKGEAGFLDAEGIWIPRTVYPADQSITPSSQLTVLGFTQSYRHYWQQLYPWLINSPVKIRGVDWRDPSNLILTTELGKVHFGTYGDNFPQQLKALIKLRQLPSQVSIERIIYIDLSNPNAPSVHLKDPPIPNLFLTKLTLIHKSAE